MKKITIILFAFTVLATVARGQGHKQAIGDLSTGNFQPAIKSTGIWSTTTYNPAYMDAPAKYDTVKCWFKELSVQETYGRIVSSIKNGLQSQYVEKDSTIIEKWQHGYVVSELKSFNMGFVNASYGLTIVPITVAYLYSDKTKVKNKVIYSYEK